MRWEDELPTVAGSRVRIREKRATNTFLIELGEDGKWRDELDVIDRIDWRHWEVVAEFTNNEWCRSEVCRWRWWRSGSVPTHRIWVDCPDYPTRKHSEQKGAE